MVRCKGYRGCLMGLWLALIAAGRGLWAQDSNILLPVPEIERRLQSEPFEVFRRWGSRWQEDLTMRVLLRFEDGKLLQAKWKRAAEGGWADNNEPRYEVAAYELQKLFLDPRDYVVPPTTGRTWPVTRYREVEKAVRPTFRGTASVYFLLQYWLENVTSDDVWDKKRFRNDPKYAYHFANMNIVTYLVEHKDANKGNVLISTDPNNPRVFVVDNSLAFNSKESTRGTKWRRVLVDRLPENTVERLRSLGLARLERALGVVEQYVVDADGLLQRVPPGENLDPDSGVRRKDDVVQFGLTRGEINRVYERLEKLLERIEAGKIQTFAPVVAQQDGAH